MRQATMFCKHYRAASEHTTCSAGVDYETIKPLPFDQRPCFAHVGDTAPKPGCDLVVLPTLEEQEAEEREIRERFGNIGKARQAIVAACGGPWKKGKPSILGAITCPVCGGHLEYRRSGCNGHIHARCKTDGCVKWVE